MRLWHQDLLSLLPRQWLLGQHREICALRGRGWGRKHATVDYVFRHEPVRLYRFHWLVMQEMERRGYRVDPVWYDPAYRGKTSPPFQAGELGLGFTPDPIYPEHDAAYLFECQTNLLKKGVRLPLEK